MSLFEELKRRNVFRVGIAYVVMAWLLAQVADLFLENFHAPDWVIQSFLVLLVIGFPLAIFFAWAFELTPDGVKKEKDVDRSRSVTSKTGRKLDFVIIALLAIGLVYFLWESRFSDTQSNAYPQQDRGAEAIIGETETVVPPAPSSPSPATLSIAVLPFVNMSGEAENEFFSDGVSEEILNVLARIPELKVAARTSAFGYKGTKQNISDIARELNVANILEGSVRKFGNQVRVTAQLIEAENGFHLWSETYDRQLDNIFAIQDEIAQAIASELKVSLKLADNTSGNLTGTNNVDAYEHYLQGMALWHLRTLPSLYAAVEEFNQAIALDPEFARAYAGLALTWTVLPGYGHLDQDGAELNATTAAHRALELNPDLPEAMIALGNIAGINSSFEEAHDYFERAIALNPSLATSYQWYGQVLAYSGESEKAIRHFETAMDLDPHSRIIPYNYAWVLIRAGRTEEALQVNLRSLETAPDFPDGIQLAMLLKLMAGDCAAVERYGKRVAEILGKPEGSERPYVEWCQAEDPGTRSLIAEQLAETTYENFADPQIPVLTYEWDLLMMLIEVQEFEAALTLLQRVIEDEDSPGAEVLWFRSGQTKNGRAFSCDARAQALFARVDLPPRPPGQECN